MLIGSATLPDGETADVRVEDGQIAAVGDLPGDPDVDATGKRLFPGAVDVHVHFRQPGAGHKETWTTGSRSAAGGGVTTVVDQPNTDPPTTTPEAFDRKAAFAADSLVDYGINGGVLPDWDPDGLLDRPVFALGEIFLADSTGDMGIDEATFREALRVAADRDITVTVHAEDADRFDADLAATAPDEAEAWSRYRPVEAEVRAVERACELAAEVGTDLHVAHTSTPEAVDVADAAGATCEVTPHHLFLSRADLPELGTFGRMNPPLRSPARRAGLAERTFDPDGPVDCVATDHAPHTRAEKAVPVFEAPSGVPGVETMLPLLLAAAHEGTVSYDRVADLTARRPAEVFDCQSKGRVEPGADADLVLVDPEAVESVRADRLHSKADWTPFEGQKAVFPELVTVRGETVYRRGDENEERFGDPAGQNVRS